MHGCEAVHSHLTGMRPERKLTHSPSSSHQEPIALQLEAGLLLLFIRDCWRLLQYGSLTGSRGCCEFMSASGHVQKMTGIPDLWLTTIPLPLSQRSVSLGWWWPDRDAPFMTEHSTDIISSLHFGQLWLGIIWCAWQKEASLMMAESCTVGLMQLLRN